MTVELLQNLSLAAYLAGGVFLAVAVGLFFLFRVPQIVGDLSGTTARRAIESIEQRNSGEGRRKDGRPRREREKFATGRLRRSRQKEGTPQTSGPVRESAAPETTGLMQRAKAPETTGLVRESAAPEMQGPMQESAAPETSQLWRNTPMSGGEAPDVTVDVNFGFSESTETID